MQFTTPIPIAEAGPKIDYGSRIVSLGSCFAVNMGQKLDYFKLENTINPFGILFHPPALEKVITYSIENKTFTEADIFYHNELWHSFDAHSDLSHPDKDMLLNNLNRAATALYCDLKAASHIIITLGTAWVYRYNDTKSLVANCHKVPQKHFTKELLSAESITRSLDSIIERVSKINISAQFIFTVSPVRHIKDGFVQNQWSKANLISALHQTINQEPQTNNCHYFPSYEIMMDELRDYRFYNEDLIHPNQMAINYIWQRFVHTWIHPDAQKTLQAVDTIQKGLLHRSFNPDSVQHKAFLDNLQHKKSILQQQHPNISF